MCIYLEQAMNISSKLWNIQIKWKPIISSFDFLLSIEADITRINLIGSKVAIYMFLSLFLNDELDIEPIWFWLVTTTTTTTGHSLYLQMQ